MGTRLLTSHNCILCTHGRNVATHKSNLFFVTYCDQSYVLPPRAKVPPS